MTAEYSDVHDWYIQVTYQLKKLTDLLEQTNMLLEQIASPPNVLYACDGEVENCRKTNCYAEGGGCRKTSDIEHAVNFEKKHNFYTEIGHAKEDAADNASAQNEIIELP